MAKYQRFEDLPVWQEAARLYNTVLDLRDCSTGIDNEREKLASRGNEMPTL